MSEKTESTSASEAADSLPPEYSEMSADELVDEGLELLKNRVYGNMELAGTIFLSAYNKGSARGAIWLAYMMTNHIGCEGSEETAFDMLDSLSDDGDPEITAHLSEMYMIGIGTEKNPSKASKYLKSALKDGSVYAEVLMGLSEMDGADFPDAPKKARAYFSSAASKGEPRGCYCYARTIEADDPTAAAMSFFKASSMGHPESMLALSEMFTEGRGVAKDKKLAERLCTLAFLSGNSEAAIRLKAAGIPCTRQEIAALVEKASVPSDTSDVLTVARMCENGIGLPQDYVAAVKWYKMASDRLIPEGMGGYAAMLYEGRGIDQDVEGAAMLFSKSAEAGDTRSEYYMGQIYNYKHVFEQDPAKAIGWYLKGVEKGYAPSVYEYALMLRKGRSIEHDDVSALKYLKQSAESGYPQAQYQYGLFLVKGIGCEPDAVASEYWLTMAKLHGYDPQ